MDTKEEELKSDNSNTFDIRQIYKMPINVRFNIKKCRDEDFLSAQRARVKSMFTKKAKLTKYGCLITINPDSTINMDNFLGYRNSIINYVEKKKWCKDALITYEQRTESLVPPWTGFHTHILISFKDKIRPYKVNAIKEITQSLEKKVKYKFNVNYKYLKTIEDYNRAHDYLTGYKADSTKRLKHKSDLKFRQHFNI